MSNWLNTLLVYTVFSVLFVGCATTSGNKEEAELRLQMGTGYLTQGKYPAALRELLKAESLDPENAVVQNNLGIAYFVRDKFEEAQIHLRKALQLRPDYTDARNNLGRVLIELTRYDDAVRELELVINDLTYGSPDKAWVNLGLAYFRKGNYTVAKTKFIEAVRLNRQNCLGQTLYGRSLMELGEFAGAARTLDNAVTLCGSSEFDEPHYFSGLSYYKLGQVERATARMEEVIKLYPNGKYAKKAQSLLQMMR